MNFCLRQKDKYFCFQLFFCSFNLIMKRIITTILFICYLIPCLGVSVRTHYCGGKFTSFSILPSKSVQCCCGKKAMKKGCCENKVTFVKAPQDHNIQKINAHSSLKTSQFCKAILFSTYSFLSNYTVDPSSTWTDPPPGPQSLSLYLLNKVFRI